MRKLIITESEKKYILQLHKPIILKENAGEKLALIQTALGTAPDKIIGPKTTSKIVSALGTAGIKADYTCVTSLTNGEIMTITNTNNQMFEEDVEVIDMTMKGADGKTTGGVEYQIGEILFKPDGTYYDLNKPNVPLKYTCSSTTIQTSNNGNIEKGSKIKKAPESIKLDVSPIKQIPTNEPTINVPGVENRKQFDINNPGYVNPYANK